MDRLPGAARSEDPDAAQPAPAPAGLCLAAPASDLSRPERAWRRGALLLAVCRRRL